jgi:hypothetical protein
LVFILKHHKNSENVVDEKKIKSSKDKEKGHKGHEKDIDKKHHSENHKHSKEISSEKSYFISVVMAIFVFFSFT